MNLKIATWILGSIGLGILIYKIYGREQEMNSFVSFHKEAVSNIRQGKRNHYPFFKDDRLNRMENHVKNLEKYINDEKKIIIKDKHNLQTIIADISHQVKTPISNIKMINEILLSRKLEEAQSREFLESMNNEIEKLDFLMQSMITISFLETGIMKFNTRILPIYETIVSSLNSSISLINERKIDIELICKEDILVKHDPKWTVEAISNIINNGVKFSPKMGKIVITVIQEEFYTSISIKDYGRGIERENIKYIFNKLYSRDEEEGSGIGLHLTEKVIRGQNGYINVNSEVDCGTEFILYLPNS